MGLYVRGLSFFLPLEYLCLGLAPFPIFICRPNYSEDCGYKTVLIADLLIKNPQMCFFFIEVDMILNNWFEWDLQIPGYRLTLDYFQSQNSEKDSSYLE